MKIIVYTTTDCPHCAQLKAALADLGHGFEEQDMTTRDALADLRIGGVFTLAAPVLRIYAEEGRRDEFYEWSELTENETLIPLDDVIK